MTEAAVLIRKFTATVDQTLAFETGTSIDIGLTKAYADTEWVPSTPITIINADGKEMYGEITAFPPGGQTIRVDITSLNGDADSTAISGWWVSSMGQ